MVKRYKITYVFENDLFKRKHTMWKFGTNAADIEATFNQYQTEPTKIIEIEISDDED